jgi:hypothetical protein
MTQHGENFDEFLRRVLHEEANAVEPADDGLERIRARLTRPRRAPVAWVMAVSSGTGYRVLGAARSASAWLQALPGAAQARLRSPRGHRPRGWRSPVVLTAAAVVAVAAGVLALTPLPGQAVSGTAGLIRSITGGHGGGAAGPGGQAEGSGGAQPAPAAASSPPGTRAHRSPAASPSPSASRSRAASPAPSSSTAAASPAPSPTSSPSPCPSASSSPAPTPSPSPSQGTCPSPSPSPAGGAATPTAAPDPGA